MLAHLALGSNLGDRAAHLQAAVDGLRAAAGVTVVARSRVYETDPVGGPDQEPYLNAVVAIDTSLGPWELLALGQQLEARAQRVRAQRWGPRTLDVDILLYDDITMSDERLTIPHPRMWDRAFVLVPLEDVAPELVRGHEVDASGVRPTTLRLS